MKRSTFWIYLEISSWFRQSIASKNPTSVTLLGSSHCIIRRHLASGWATVTMPRTGSERVSLLEVPRMDTVCPVVISGNVWCGTQNHWEVLSLDAPAPRGFGIQNCSSLKSIIALGSLWKGFFNSAILSEFISWHSALKQRLYFLSLPLFLISL